MYIYINVVFFLYFRLDILMGSLLFVVDLSLVSTCYIP